MPKTKKESKEVKQTTTKTKKSTTVKKVKSSTPKRAKTKSDDKMEAVLQIIANLKTENKRLMDWLTTHKLSKKDKSKIEDNIAFNENAIAHFSEIIK